jgi:Trypsin-like peptidase domain/PEGA domain
MGYSQNSLSLSNQWFKTAIKVTLLSVLVISQTTHTTQAQTEKQELSLTLRANVVRIESHSNGFGFIVGERNGLLYIVTARHVVAGSQENPDSTNSKIAKITFYSEQENVYDAKILRSDSTHDLALLSVSSPQGFQWQRTCLAAPGSAVRGSHVWFVGRNATWYVPVEPGAVTSERPGIDSRIQLEHLEVRPGSSGAPLISNVGIVGMIQNDSPDDTRALTIDFIRSAMQEWNDPWNLDLTSLRADPNPPKNDAPSSCQISINSTPSGAEVSIDGASRGDTPATAELAPGQSHSLKIEKEKYETYQRQIDCNSKNVDAKLKKAVGNMRLQYTGDYLACTLALEVTIGDKTFRPTGNSFAVRDVPLGDQDYSISGRIGCPNAGICNVRGSGSIDVRDGSIFNVTWANTAYGTCDVELIAQ